MITINSAGQAVSAAFLSAMQKGFTIATACQLWTVGASPAQVNTPITLSGCTVTIDRKAQQRRRVTMTLEVVDGSALIPTSLSSPLAPYGNELKPFFGVTYPNGTTELVPMGVFPFTTVDVDDDGKSIRVSVDGYDRSWVVSSLKFKTPYAVAAGTDLATAIRTLINSVVGSVYPNLQFNIAPTTGITTPAANFQEGTDPWAAALTLAAAGGYDLFFGVNGEVIGQATPDPTKQTAAWNYAEPSTSPLPSPNTVPEKVRRILTRDGIANDFIASGVGTGNTTTGPVRAASSDTNPSSPTYVSGPFGDVPSFVTSSLITSTAQAQNAAANALQASLAKADQLQVTGRPNPLLDIDDVIGVYRRRLHLLGARFVADSITHSIRHDDSMVVAGRKVA